MPPKRLTDAKRHRLTRCRFVRWCLNDQETDRENMLCTWSNEQAIREIYLKPFEPAAKEGGANAVMSSFNFVGNRPAATSDAMLCAFDTGGNLPDDTASATSVKAMRQACKNIMYTVVNSRVYDKGGMGGLMTWQILMIGADVAIGILLLILEVLTIRRYLKRRKAEGTK